MVPKSSEKLHSSRSDVDDDDDDDSSIFDFCCCALLGCVDSKALEESSFVSVLAFAIASAAIQRHEETVHTAVNRTSLFHGRCMVAVGCCWFVVGGYFQQDKHAKMDLPNKAKSDRDVVL